MNQIDQSRILQLLDDAREQQINDKILFLEAYKEAAHWLGPRWWCLDKTTPYRAVKDPIEAESKWQICPRMDLIRDQLGVLSSGEAAMLAAMASFYDSEGGHELMLLAGIHGLADLAARLDTPQRRWLADMLLHYPGW